MNKIEKQMELNRETAMRLWNKTFGKETRAIDFAGRSIVKGAYNDRQSEFGWNVDHVLPQSKGGVTADYNLICCSILTNDEKADKFPCFKANDVNFEIIKVQNHYEIKKKNNILDEYCDDLNVNFLDSASGIRFFKQLKGIQNKPRFVGTVTISLGNVANTAIIDFIEKVFDLENISFSLSDNFFSSTTTIVVKNYDMPMNSDISMLLDKCIMLNTYFKEYFVKLNYLECYKMIYRIDHYQTKTEMYVENKNIGNPNLIDCDLNTLYINDLVVINTDVKNKIDIRSNILYYEYNYVYTNLSKQLEKEVNGK